MRAPSPKNLKTIILEVFTHPSLVGFLIFVSLVLPGLLLRSPAPVDEDWAPRTETGTEWVGFAEFGALLVEFTPAAALEVDFGLMRTWPPDPVAAAADLGPYSGTSEIWLEPVFEVIRWQEGRLSFERSEINNGRLHYHVMPSFSFDNNTLQWSGLHIRLWVNF